MHTAASDDARAPGVSWDVVRTVPWPGGTHVHLEQSWRGLRVDRQGRVVSLGTDDQVRRTAGAAAIDAGALSVVPSVPEGRAVTDAEAWVDAFVGARRTWTPRSELVVHVDAHDEAHLAWAVDLGVAQPFSTWRVWVDAHDGRVLSSARTSHDARGNVYPSNPDASTLTEVELQGLVTPDFLIGELAYAWSCDDFGGFSNCSAKSSHATPDGQGNYLFEPDATGFDDPLAEVQMYHHLDLVSRWFGDRYAFALSEPIEGLVNFEMDNAFYGDADGDGVSEVAFGQGSTIDFAYDADVIYHEFGHAVIGTVSTLGFFGADAYGIDFAPLSLNEGSADLFSMMITNDPVLGEYAGSGFGLAAIRDLGPDRRCPHDLYGEGHEDGMIWGAVGWNLAEDPTVGPEVTADLAYGAATSWVGALSWAQAGDSLVAAADDLLAAGEIDATTHTNALAIIDAGGLPGCERVIPLDDGDRSTQLFFATGLADQVGGYVPLSSQYSLEAPEGTKKLVFEIESFSSSVPGTKWSVFVRRGAFVEHELMNVLGIDVPVPSIYDAVIDGEGTDKVVINASSDLVLEPGETYFFSVATRADGLSAFDLAVGEARVSGSSTPEDPADPTDPTVPTGTDPTDEPPVAAGDGADDEDLKAGCGCQTPAPLVGWLVLPVAMLALRRRR